MTGKDEHTGPTAGEDNERADEIIGLVFLRSIVAVGILATVALGTYLWTTRETPAVAIRDSRVPDLVPLLDRRNDLPVPALPFFDVTTAAGIRFRHQNGARGEHLLPETMGGGVAVFDYDRDGDADLLFVDSGPWPDQPDYASWNGSLNLYRNDGAWRFVDVTREAGLHDVRAYGMGVAVGDADGDGWSDLLLTAVGPNHFFRNMKGVFHDITSTAGLAGEADVWSSSAGFFDADRDGDLDLFVTNYVQWSRARDFELDYRLDGVGRAYGPPTNFPGQQNYFYRNLGDGRFEDISADAGIHVSNDDGFAIGKGLGLITEDIDRDGWIDVMVANDTVRNFVFHNRAGKDFEEVGESWGLAYDRNGLATGAMGIDLAEPYSDGRVAIAIGNFANEMTSMYVRQTPVLQFADESMVAGIGPESRRALSFGVLFADVDLDGHLDLIQANGHVENEINRVQASQQYAQPAQIFWQCGSACRRRFVSVPAEKLGDLGNPAVGRGLTSADFDGDGDLDFVLTQVGAAPRLLRNDLPKGPHWLSLRLERQGSVDRAIGARIELRTSAALHTRTVQRTRGYLAQVDPTVHFGLGQKEKIVSININWPDGSVQQLGVLEVDRHHTISYPEGA